MTQLGLVWLLILTGCLLFWSAVITAVITAGN